MIDINKLADDFFEKSTIAIAKSYIKAVKYLEKDKAYYATVKLPGGRSKTPNIFVFSDQAGGFNFVKAFMEVGNIPFERVDIKQIKFVEKVVLKKRLECNYLQNDYRSNQDQNAIDEAEKNPSSSLVCLIRGLRKTRSMPGFYLQSFLNTSSVEEAMEVLKGVTTSIPVRTLYFYKITGKSKSYFYN